jgi:hypothetical protein
MNLHPEFISPIFRGVEIRDFAGDAESTSAKPKRALANPML